MDGIGTTKKYVEGNCEFSQSQPMAIEPRKKDMINMKTTI